MNLKLLLNNYFYALIGTRALFQPYTDGISL